MCCAQCRLSVAKEKGKLQGFWLGCRSLVAKEMAFSRQRSGRQICFHRVALSFRLAAFHGSPVVECIPIMRSGGGKVKEKVSTKLSTTARCLTKLTRPPHRSFPSHPPNVVQIDHYCTHFKSTLHFTLLKGQTKFGVLKTLYWRCELFAVGAKSYH